MKWYCYILFWTDHWLGGIPLSVRFHRLFELTDNPLMSVDDMFAVGWGKGVRLGSSDDVVCMGGGNVMEVLCYPS